MRRVTTLVVLIAGAAVSMAVARAQRDPLAIQLQAVKNNLYVITGGPGAQARDGVSGNTTVFLADTGVVLVDTKLPGFGQAILEQVRTVSDKPVVMIINTHSHADHTSGNIELPRNIERVAHANTAANMSRMEPFKVAGAPLPTRTFGDRLSLPLGRDRIDLYYFGRGHTNGDAIVVFPGLRTAVMGDLFARKGAPAVDAANGGSMLEFPETLAKAASGLSNVDTLITGHANTPAARPGPVLPSSAIMTLDDLREYAAFTRDLVEAARTARAAGRTADEAFSGLKLSDRYRDYEMTSARADIQRVFEELK
jgi:glyoxylase-like metal-dependent hydrolase (beta-lactamase superfamily II)